MDTITSTEQSYNPDHFRNARRVLILRVLAAIILVIYAVNIHTTLGGAGSLIMTTSFLVLAAGIAGLLFLFLKRIPVGVVLSLTGIYIAIILLGIFIQNLGWILLISLLVFTALAVTNTVEPRTSRTLLLISSVIGFVILLFDLFVGKAAFRFQLENLSSVLAVFIALIAASLLVNLPIFIRQFSFFTLRSKLILAIAMIAIVSLGITSYINTRTMERALTQEANQALFSAASQTRDSIMDLIVTNLSNVRTEASLPLLVQYLEMPSYERGNSELDDQVAATLSVLRSRDIENISSVALLDNRGRIVADTEKLDIGSVKTDRSYFTEPVNSGLPYVSSVEMDPNTNTPSLYFSAPVRSANDRIIGVLRVRYNAVVLQNLLEDSNGLGGSDSYAVLFDENYIHLAHGTHPENIFKTAVPLDDQQMISLQEQNRLPEWSKDQLFLNLPGLAANLAQTMLDPDSQRFFTAEGVTAGDLNQATAIPLDTPPWIIVFFQPRQSFIEPIQTYSGNTITIATLIAAGVVLLAIWLGQSFSQPISELTNAAEQVSQGNLSFRSNVVTNDEVGLLSNAFNNMTSQLNMLVNELDTQVQARTQVLEKRISRQQITSEIARDVAKESSLDVMLERAVILLSERLDLYHVGLYLMDMQQENARLIASNGETGKLLIESKYQQNISSQSNVSYVCLSGEARLAIKNDDSTPPVSQHPLLPYSQSQLVIPMTIDDRIIGVLDLQSDQMGFFTQSDIEVFHILASHISNVIQKINHTTEMQRNLSELESSYGQFTQQAWQRLIQTKSPVTGYRYHQLDISPVNESPPEVYQAWQWNQPVIRHREENDGESEEPSVIAIPIRVRGQVIAVIDLQFDAGRITSETSAMIEDIADRLSLVLENARLVEATQKSVERERLTSEISNRIRETLDIDEVIRTAVQEIGDNLGLKEVEIRIGIPANLEKQVLPVSDDTRQDNGNQEGEQ